MPEKPPFYLKKYYRTYSARLERMFRKELGGRYDVRVVHDADQKALWDALHSPENVGVFWLSHSAETAVVDEFGFDITPVFAEAHPNLRYLAVIGCRSEQALAKLREERLDRSNPELVIKTFDRKVNARKGLEQALRAARSVLNQPEIVAGYPARCEARMGYPVRIARQLGESDLRHGSTTRIEVKGEVLGVFPRIESSSRAELEVHVPAVPSVSARDLKVVLNQGSPLGFTPSAQNLGRLEFEAAWTGAEWKLFADREGNPIGLTQNVYQYKGALPTSADATEYHPFECRDMEPR